MRLESIAIEGYKRFADRSVMRTRGKVSCLVGPNEAGKTTVLEAFAGLFETGWPGEWVFSGRTSPAPDKVILSARYRPQDDDFEHADELLAGRKLANSLRAGDMYIEHRKRGDGTSGAVLYDAPQRSISGRHRLADEAGAALTSAWFEQLAARAPARYEELRPMLERLTDDLRSADSDLAAEVVERVRVVAAILGHLESAADVDLSDEARAAMIKTRADLGELHEEESQPRPGRVLVNALAERCPRFSLFADAERVLPTFQPYDTTPPRAVLNLLRLAELDFDELQAAAVAQDRPRLAT